MLNQNLPSILIGLEDEQDDLLQYSNKALFIKGENSDYITKSDEIMINEYFKNVQMVTIKDASHWVHAEKPDEFVRVVKEFVLS